MERKKKRNWYILGIATGTIAAIAFNAMSVFGVGMETAPETPVPQRCESTSKADMLESVKARDDQNYMLVVNALPEGARVIQCELSFDRSVARSL